MPKALRDTGGNLIGLLMDLPIIGAFAVRGSPPLTVVVAIALSSAGGG